MVVWERTGLSRSVPLHAEQHISWNDFLRSGEGQRSDVERMEANEPAFILATSGTTAKLSATIDPTQDPAVTNSRGLFMVCRWLMLTAAAGITCYAVILFDLIFQGLAIAFIAGE